MTQIIHWTLVAAAVIAGLISAWLWWKSASVEIRRGDQLATGPVYIGERQVDMQATATWQSRYNRQAAIATAISVLLGAISNAIPWPE